MVVQQSFGIGDQVFGVEAALAQCLQACQRGRTPLVEVRLHGRRETLKLRVLMDGGLEGNLPGVHAAHINVVTRALR